MSNESTERQIELMDTLGIWYSRVVGPWIEDGGVAVRIPEVFPLEQSVEFFCTHSNDEEADWHPFTLEAACLSGEPLVSTDPWKGLTASEGRKRAPKRMESMVESLTRAYWRHPIEAGKITFGKPARIGNGVDEGRIGDHIYRRLVLDDGRWFCIQQRYWEGINALGVVDRWEAVFLPHSSTTEVAPREYPLIVGLSADNRVSAFVMPIHGECNQTPTREVESAVPS